MEDFDLDIASHSPEESIGVGQQRRQSSCLIPETAGFLSLHVTNKQMNVGQKTACCFPAHTADILRQLTSWMRIV